MLDTSKRTLSKLTSPICRFAIVISLLIASGCASIHFDNGKVVKEPSSGFLGMGLFLSEEDKQGSPRERKSYHHALFGLAELSNALEMDLVCPGQDWNRVTSEVTPVDAVLGLLDNAILIRASSPALDLWSTWTIEYSCK